jgi:hypothetical protein
MAEKKISLMDTRPDVAGFTFREVVIGGVVANYKVKDWMTATSAPSVTFDSADGYGVGSMVLHLGILYVCQSAAVGAAVWNAQGGGGGGGLTSQNSIIVSSVNTGVPLADAIANGVLMKAAIIAADALVVGTRAIDNRVAVVLAGGTYDANGVGFTIPSFMDIVGLNFSAGDTILTNTGGDYTLIAGLNVDYGLYNIDLRGGSIAALNDNAEVGQFHRWDNVLISGAVTTGMIDLFGDFRRVRATNDVDWAVVSGSVGGYHEIEFDTDVTQVYNCVSDLGGVINIRKAGNFGEQCFYAVINFIGSVKIETAGDFSDNCFFAEMSFTGSVQIGNAGDFGLQCFYAVNNFTGSVKIETAGDFGILCFYAEINFTGSVEIGIAGNFGNNCFFATIDFTGSVEIGNAGNFGSQCFAADTNFTGSVKIGTAGDFVSQCFYAANTDFTGSVKIETAGDFGGNCFYTATLDFTGSVEIGTAGNFGGFCFAADTNFTGSVKIETAGDFGILCFYANNDFTGSVEIGTTGDFGNNCMFAANDFTGSVEIGTAGDFGGFCMFAGAIFAPIILNSNIDKITSELTGSLINSTVRTNAVQIGDGGKIEGCKIIGNDATHSITGTATAAQILDTNTSMPIDTANISGVLNGNYDNTSLS